MYPTNHDVNPLQKTCPARSVRRFPRHRSRGEAETLSSFSETISAIFICEGSLLRFSGYRTAPLKVPSVVQMRYSVEWTRCYSRQSHHRASISIMAALLPRIFTRTKPRSPFGSFSFTIGSVQGISKSSSPTIGALTVTSRVREKTSSLPREDLACGCSSSRLAPRTSISLEDQHRAPTSLTGLQYAGGPRFTRESGVECAEGVTRPLRRVWSTLGRSRSALNQSDADTAP